MLDVPALFILFILIIFAVAVIGAFAAGARVYHAGTLGMPPRILGARPDRTDPDGETDAKEAKEAWDNV